MTAGVLSVVRSNWPVNQSVRWNLQRLRHLADIRPSNVDKKSVDGEVDVRLCNYTDVYYNDSISADVSFMAATAPLAQVKRFELRQDDVLVTKDSETSADIAIASHVRDELPGVLCAYHLAILRPLPHVAGRFLLYALQSRPLAAQTEVAATGVTRFSLSTGALADLTLPVPDRAEQRAIADFLDHETEKIDALVAKKQRLLELLQEKRTALISHAVTKGLDPTASMKDSGIEWLGRIASAWEVRRLKQVTEFVTSGSRGWAEFYSDEGAIFIRITNLDRESIDIDLSQIQRVNPPAGSEGERTRVRSGDVLVSITADIGTVGLVPHGLGDAYVNQHTALTRPRRSLVEPRWLALCLHSSVGQRQFPMLLQGGTKVGLNLDEVRSLVVVLPPLAEQKRLTGRVDDNCERMTKLTASVQAAIARLQEYRSALITAAVTGQIDVRTYRQEAS